MNAQELKQQRAALISQAREVLQKADVEKRSATPEELKSVDDLQVKIDAMAGDVARLEKLEASERELGTVAERRSAQDPAFGAPTMLKIKRGDTEERALAHYVRTGDAQALGELRQNANDMTIADNTYAGYAVPTGHYNNIIARRDVGMLARVLGCMPIPGKGTTVNVPTDNAATTLFVSTNETGAFDLDAPVLGQAAMTLVKYTKKIQLSVELLRDEDSKLMTFLENWVARSMALTHNSLLVTAAAAGGTSVTLGAVAAATAGDPQDLVYSVKAEYLDSGAFLMARATESKYRKLSGSDWQYAPAFSNTGNVARPGGIGTLWNFPVYNSASVAAIGSGNKSSIFGNFGFVGLREGDGFTFLRDPYGAAGTGQVNLYYYFDAVYKVLNSEAIVYGTHPTA